MTAIPIGRPIDTSWTESWTCCRPNHYVQLVHEARLYTLGAYNSIRRQRRRCKLFYCNFSIFFHHCGCFIVNC